MLDRDKVPNLQNLAISEKYFIKKKNPLSLGFGEKVGGAWLLKHGFKHWMEELQWQKME